MRAGPRASLTGDFTFDATSGNANDINTVWGFDNRNPPGEAGDNIGPPRDWVSFGGGVERWGGGHAQGFIWDGVYAPMPSCACRWDAHDIARCCSIDAKWATRVPA